MLSVLKKQTVTTTRCRHVCTPFSGCSGETQALAPSCKAGAGHSHTDLGRDGLGPIDLKVVHNCHGHVGLQIGDDSARGCCQLLLLLLKG